LTKFIADKEIYEEVICKMISNARHSVWIGTSDLKDLYIPQGKRRAIPFLQVISAMIDNSIAFRLIHAKEPGPNFRADFDRFPNLINGLERMLCPRIHFKTVIVDQRIAYLGSANLTGAGMGAKASTTRNFENGIMTDERSIVGKLIEQFDTLWMGENCDKCKRKSFCTDRIDGQ
jgi:phosphatidylserine/phosphatidylglycerophosphate/cardiolipin synthase-like enzyme